MKKNLALILSVGLMAVILTFGFAGCGEKNTDNTSDDKSDDSFVSDTTLGDYKVDIKGCRLAKDYYGKDVVIVKYGFTNNSEKSVSFTFAFKDTVYQEGIGLNGSYILADDANYDSANQTKEIKKGVTIDVEVAYELNDTTSNIEVEVKELISNDDNVVKKIFSIK